ncbi:MAG: baseplate J/gp47 family protein [Gorillibacterium sp.]|nr:baseplate J/gp47 family protein [Gorillibacterium sp.]
MTDFTPISFVDTDVHRIEQELLIGYQEALGQALYPGDPRRIFLLQMLPVLVALKNEINYTGNANLLPFASGVTLDALGIRLGVNRLTAKPAHTQLRFTLSGIQPGVVNVPQGTRVTPDGLIYFSTLSPLVIATGETEGIVIAEAGAGGESYNGFIAGQINLIVDPVPYVASVTNVDTSLGGSDVESDEAFRERQRLAPASFSVAGPKQAYVFFAKSADVNIIDVAVTSPNDGEVKVYPLMKGGMLPDQTMLEKVFREVNDDLRRPLTDHVEVLAPEVVHYTINLTYYIAKERSAEEPTIRAAIEGADGALDQYESWQYSKLGRAITPDSLISRIYGAGAYRVVTTSPIYTVIEENEVAHCNGTPALTYGGLI